MPAAEAGLSDAIAAHVAGLGYADLSPATIHAAKRALLDATGVMSAASGLCQEVLPFVDLARSTGSSGRCTILGFGDRVHAPQAALANGAMAHALDFEDVFDRAPVHPNASAIPAAIALAQANGSVDGRELIAAVAIGCDLVCRVALSLRQRLEDSGWFPPTVLGGIGAVAAAARVLRLQPAQIRDALSLALCQLTAPGEIGNSAASVIRAVREAFPAQGAVIAALLARDGVAGFERPLEGDDAFFRLYAGGRYEPAEILEGLGDENLIETLSFKPWPSCRGTHAYIQTALELRREHGVTTTDVRSVSVATGPVQRMLIEPLARKRAPQTAIDAKFSIPFTVALALARGRVTLGDFDDGARSDRELLGLAHRVEPVADATWSKSDATRGALSITLADGRVISGSIGTPLGGPSAPMNDATLIGKFVECCSHAARPLAADAARAMANRILTIDEVEDSGACFRLGSSPGGITGEAS